MQYKAALFRFLVFALTACAGTAPAAYQATTVAQQNTVIALLQPTGIHAATQQTPMSGAGTPTAAPPTSTPAVTTPTPVPSQPSATLGPEYLATVVVQNATLVARTDGASVPLQQTIIVQQATVIAAIARVNGALGTQTAAQSSHVRLQQTANAISDFQAVSLHTIRDMTTLQVSQQATANALQATSITLARVQLQEQRSTDATMVAIQRGQTQLAQTQVAIQRDAAQHAADTAYYTCLTARDTHPALTCTKPKK